MRIEDFLKRSAAQHGAGTAIKSGKGSHSYAELDYKADRLAAALQTRGIGRGDRIALFIDDGWESVVSIFAVLRAGGVISPVCPDATVEELTAALRDSGAVAIVTQARLASTAAAALTATGAVRLVVLAGGDRTEATDTCLSFEETVNRIGRVPQLAAAGEDADAAAILIDRLPVTHRAIVDDTADETIADDAVAVLPLTQRTGLSRLLAAVRTGATLVMQAPYARGAVRAGVAGSVASDYPGMTDTPADSVIVGA